MDMLSSRYTGGLDLFCAAEIDSSKPMEDKVLHCFLAVACFLTSRDAGQDEAPVEMRGAWISREDVAQLATRKEIAGAMELLAESGVNVVFPSSGTPSEPASRDLLSEILFEAHRNGLEVVPWFAPGDALEDAVVRSVIETCRNHDLDGVVGLKPFARIRKDVAALDPELVVVAPAGIEVAEGDAAFRLPEVSGSAPEKGGDVVIGLAKLLEKEGELARSLREGPFAEDARLPWRKDRVRRPPASLIEAFAGGGVWTWMAREGEPRFLAMDGGETGHASWTIEAEETGRYALYAWIPSREDLAAHSSYRIASAGSMRTVGIDTTDAKNRGWVFLGESHLVGGKSIEVARLDAEEQDATMITAAGPLLVLRSYRPKPR